MSMINEFVEEIKAKINHKKEYHKNFYEKLGDKLNDNDLHKATQLAFDDCMEFINELAEKYRDVPDTNVGKWIPVSEKLPEDNAYSDYYESVIVTLDDRRVVDGCYRNMDKEWWVDDVDGEHYSVNATGHVLAWQPLPEPYKGE